MERCSRLSRSVWIAAGLILSGVTARSDSDDLDGGQWRIAGQNLNNSRSQPDEHTISAANVASLKTKWVFTAGSDVSATPTVADDAVYFPDWAGNLYAVRKNDGGLIWKHSISEYDNVIGAIARVRPAIHGDDLIIGDIKSATLAHPGGAHIMAINRHTGSLRWITQVESHPAAMITGSPVFAGDVVYVGVSSNEETLVYRFNKT
jgi:polyvinyl alcohol dehydrogenase (cytochrome)